MREWTSWVAVGDSFTEGLSDEAPDGTYIGWADRLATLLAERNPDFRYANLAVRDIDARARRARDREARADDDDRDFTALHLERRATMSRLDLAIDRAALEVERDRAVVTLLPLDARIAFRHDDGFVSDRPVDPPDAPHRGARHRTVSTF